MVGHGWCVSVIHPIVDSSPPGQNGCHFADDICRCIFVNEKFCMLIKISLKFVPKGPIDNKPALVLIMAWRRTGNKPLSESMLTRFTDAYICSTRGRWVEYLYGWNEICDIYTMKWVKHNILCILMHWWTGWAVNQAMTWHLFDAKSLPEVFPC